MLMNLLIENNPIKFISTITTLIKIHKHNMQIFHIVLKVLLTLNSVKVYVKGLI